MSFYSDMAATATRLLTQFGMQVTVNRYEPTVTGTTGGVETYGPDLTSSAIAVFLPASKGTAEAFDNRLQNGSLSGQQLKFAIIAASSMTFEPVSNDEMVINEESWLVLGCTPINPAGTPLTYGCGLVKK